MRTNFLPHLQRDLELGEDSETRWFRKTLEDQRNKREMKVFKDTISHIIVDSDDVNHEDRLVGYAEISLEELDDIEKDIRNSKKFIKIQEEEIRLQWEDYFRTHDSFMNEIHKYESLVKTVEKLPKWFRWLFGIKLETK